MLCALQWRIITEEWMYQYLRDHADKYTEREVRMLREIGELIGDLDQLDLDDREMACLQSIALFNPCKSVLLNLSNSIVCA